LTRAKLDQKRSSGQAWSERKRAVEEYAPNVMRQAERLSSILEMLATGGALDVPGLAGRLGVSAATVRRDLHLLEGQRMLTRTHRGASRKGPLYERPRPC